MEISIQINEFVREVFLENNNLPVEDLEYILLESIRETSLFDLKKSFADAVRPTLHRKLRFLRPAVEIFPIQRELEVDVDKVTLKILVLIGEKIKMADYENDDVFGEFLYVSYASIFLGETDYLKLQSKEEIGKKRFVSGRVKSVRVKKGKRKDDFAFLVLKGKYQQKLTVLISSSFYSDFKSDLKNIRGKFIGLWGVIKWDERRKSNILAAYEIEVPGGYVIEKNPVQLRCYLPRKEKKRLA